jgi:nitroreductase
MYILDKRVLVNSIGRFYFRTRDPKEVPMDFRDVVASRRSIRSYRPDPVEEDKLNEVLEAGLLAPTACNNQPFRVVVARTAGREDALRRVYGKPWFVSAPLVLAVCSVPAEAWVRPDGKNYADVDATIAMDHMILAAASVGLGACWVGNFDTKAAREVLALEPGWEPLALTPLGYPAETPAARKRKPIEERVVRR